MLKIKGEKQPTVCLAFALGCPRSGIDLAQLYAYFVANGWRVKRRIQDADLVVIFTCGFEKDTERESMRLLSFADKKRKESSTLIVVGCLAGINPSLILSKFDAIVIPPKALDRFDDIIDARIKQADVPDLTYVDPIYRAAWSCFGYSERNEKAGRLKSIMEDAKPFVHSTLRSLGLERTTLSVYHQVKHSLGNKAQSLVEPVRNRCDIRVASGCLGECSYCAIRFAVGPLRSKPLETILAEFDHALGNSFRHFRIIAGDVGPYGQDIGTDICELFRKFFQRREEFKLTVRSINPKWFIRHFEELACLFADNREKINYLSIPVQSGNDRILELMQRQHKASRAKDCLLALREKCPDITLDTQVIVGFPSETDRDFADTLQFLKEVNFDRLLIYPYADRPHTAASKMQAKVSGEVIQDRISQLRRKFPLKTSVGL
jgi:tRNA A37 methylthiotransferase MiaB